MRRFSRRSLFTGLLLLAARTSWSASGGSPARIGWLKIQARSILPINWRRFATGCALSA